MLDRGCALNQARHSVSLDEKLSSVPERLAIRLKGPGVIRLVILDINWGNVRIQTTTKIASGHLVPAIRYLTSFQLMPQGQD